MSSGIERSAEELGYGGGPYFTIGSSLAETEVTFWLQKFDDNAG
jgi:hypothetical protein